MNDTEYQAIEKSAIAIAREAGAILLTYFNQPLRIDYKSANKRNPVTDADHAVDEYIRKTIAELYPTHGIVSEENAPDGEQATEFTWVIDPLDGTSNFLNGLPLFGVLVAVLEHGTPIIGAIFVPDIQIPSGRVLHARRGAGAFLEDIPLDISDEPAAKRRMSTWPSYFLRMYKFRKHLRRQLGDSRSLGSAGFELALAARGALDYVTFQGLWAWDLAAGLLLVQEAGGQAMEYDRTTNQWKSFDGFGVGSNNQLPSAKDIHQWRGTVVLGRPDAVTFITSGLGLPAHRWRRLKNRVLGWFRH